MAITIIYETAAQYYAGSPMAFRLQTDKYVQTPGQKIAVVIVITPGNEPGVGDIIEIASNWGFTLTFTFVASNPSTNELTAYSSGTLAAYIAQLIAELQQNYVIGTFFDLADTSPLGYTFGSITLSKRDSGIINLSGNTGGFSVVHSNVVIDPVYRPNFSFILELYVEQPYNSGNYGKATSQLANAVFNPVPNADSQADVYINDVLYSFLTFDFPQLPADNILAKLCTNIQVRCWLRITEAYGNPVTVQPWSQSLYRFGFGVKGTIKDSEYNQAYDPSPAAGPTVNKFMTRCPDKEVLPNQPEWLTYRRDDVAINNILIKVTFADGTLYSAGTAPQINKSTLDAVSGENDVIMIEAGYAQLGLDALPSSSPVAKWEIQFLDAANDTLYKPKVYYLKDQPFLYVRYFIFQNSLGGVDTLRCTGTLTKLHKVEREKSYRAREFTFQNPQRLVISTVTDEEMMYELNTGHIKKAYADYLQEFLRSEYVYEYKNGAYYPVQIEPGSWELFEEGKGMYSITFKFITAYEETVY